MYTINMHYDNGTWWAQTELDNTALAVAGATEQLAIQALREKVAKILSRPNQAGTSVNKENNHE